MENHSYRPPTHPPRPDSDVFVMPLTKIPLLQKETSKTDETATVTNREFLRTVFGSQLSGAKPVVVTFVGNPSTVGGAAWSGMPWKPEDYLHEDLSPDANCYFSLATFRPDESERYRRKKSQFKGLYAVMLDDIGTKVDIDRLTLRPSWLLETSPGNYQAGYLFCEPLIDSGEADRLMNAVVQAGLCDPGANGPCARLARLPVAVNGKHNPAYRCRLAQWAPHLRYSVQEFVEGLQVEMLPPRMQRVTRHRAQGQVESLPALADEAEVWIPCPDENQVLTALRDRRIYKAPLGEGKHDITCPWVLDHTDEIDHGTAYFEPDDAWPIGGFKCFHGHCVDRHIRDLLSVLGVEYSAARMKPTIRVVPGELHRVVDAAERELAHSGRHYQRGGLLVTVVTDPGTRETCVKEVSQHALVRVLAGTATWLRYDSRGREWARIDPPQRHSQVLHAASSYAHMPVLNGITRQPYLRPDGTLMNIAGYDSATGMFGSFDASNFHSPAVPSRADAESALHVIQDLLKEFSFASESDRAAALSAILTAAIRPSLPLAPMFHVRAHMAGSGKSYLCELITAFVTPQRGTPTTFPADDEECRKLLLAELLRAPAVIEFDNLTGDLVAHKSLCTTLTSEHLTGRILGVSKTATVNTRALFLSSGNNVGPVQDMARRCISICLDPGLETPAARTFTQPDLVREVLLERGRYVSAALTIVRAWIVAGRPLQPCRSLAGYGDWSALCRQPLLWLGCADPTDSMFDAMVEDPDRETLSRLLTAWYAEFGSTPAMVRDAVKRSQYVALGNEELREVIHDIADERGEINRRKLGWWIKRRAGRIVDGLRFVRAEGNSSAEKWRVESVSSVLPVSQPRSGKNVGDSSSAGAYSAASRGF